VCVCVCVCVWRGDISGNAGKNKVLSVKPTFGKHLWSEIPEYEAGEPSLHLPRIRVGSCCNSDSWFRQITVIVMIMKFWLE